jgi:FlaA1/EpsC-like NDP-sugar epimerase
VFHIDPTSMKDTWISTNHLLALPRGYKRALALLADVALCVLTVWLAICFRFESWISLSGYQWLAVGVSVFLAIPLLAAFGFYHTVIRFAGKQVIETVLRAMGIYTLIYSAIFTVYGLPLVPRTIGILQPLLLLVGLALLRLSARQLLGESASALASKTDLPTVLIYGAGNSGQQLAASLQASGLSRVVGFIDDNTSLHKARIAGILVYGPQQLGWLTAQHRVRDVLLAMPSLSRSRRNDIIKLLSARPVAVRTLPSLSDLAQSKITEQALRELDIEDLLGRDPVEPITELLTKNITGKVVMVTGAGGSIGSELCRQIAKLSPSQLILLEQSEFALYNINEELSALTQALITPLLANVQDQTRITQIITSYRPQTIYHAAAYKHVPLVESNPLAGLRNNILGTLHVAQAALAAGVHDMVLISTDKAVRPTNVMGASKRISEIVLQLLASQYAQQAQSTRICMVRFGNVLGSSGSVVPKFREQIKQGGPITLTHADITRYFMTIPEASQLVIQAAALHQSHQDGAKIYLLDMGESVKIIDLAKTMVQLSGLKIQDAANPQGDIAIAITGLRPGEKLFEELLISGTPLATRHPKILMTTDAADPTSGNTLERIVQLCESAASITELTAQLTAMHIGYHHETASLVDSAAK